MSGVLVTGTDTGVGKTRVACELARALVGEGVSVGVMKPVETGIADAGDDAAPEGSDVAALLDASGSDAPLSDVAPYRYALAAAPAAAALAEGGPVGIDVLLAAFARLRARHDIVLVEGAGGLLVPLVGRYTYADLAATLRIPLLIVTRTTLGTLNHTALTERVALAHGARVLGIVLNNPDGPCSDADRENLSVLRDVVHAPRLGEIPHGGTLPDLERRRLVDVVRTANP